MAQKTKKGRNWPGIIIGAALIIALVAGGGYAAFLFAAGSGEASVDAGDAAQQLDATDNATVYRIDQENSEARFIIDEVLNGNPFTVVGTTNEIGGDIVVNTENPAASEVGEIIINARTLETDSGNRDRALRTFILQSAQDEYEFITFQPTSISGLPAEPIAAGSELNFQITGNLTVIETTTEVTFDTTATLNESGSLVGLATLTIPWQDLGIAVFRTPPQVASVDENITLELDFVANPVTE